MKLHRLCGVLTLALFLVTAPATAQRAEQRARAQPRCDGHLATIRTSSVRPGKWDDFARAVAAHREWYTRHGGGARVTLARVLQRDRRAGDTRFADTQAVTITVFRDAAAPTPQRDQAWQDFVAAYAASSKVEHEVRVCLPELG